MCVCVCACVCVTQPGIITFKRITPAVRCVCVLGGGGGRGRRGAEGGGGGGGAGGKKGMGGDKEKHETKTVSFCGNG